MPSPFPGMDPFIERQSWKGFHTSYLAVLRDQLVAQLRPRYIVQIEEYVYLAREDEEPDRLIEPDLAVVEGSEYGEYPAESRSAAFTLVPKPHTVPLPRKRRQKFLSILSTESRNVVTVVELLSPTNKKPGDGQADYLLKRSNVFDSLANLVEIDLLRGGRRLPTREPLEPADFYAFVFHRQRLPHVDVYEWTMPEPLPVIPVPLAGNDPDAALDLQAAFTTTYDRAGYDYALNYRAPVEPPLDDAAAEWVRSVLEGRIS
jgi:hypothetical protein